jgi:hypothetical protein
MMKRKEVIPHSLIEKPETPCEELVDYHSCAFK